MKSNESFLRPDWPCPENIRAVISTRKGGVSLPPYDSLNLADHVGDDAASLRQNRALFKTHLQQISVKSPKIQWLRQVHGVKIFTLEPSSYTQTAIEADASYSSSVGYACTVLTADCLPLLVCSKNGREVAAVHAGWRGLAAGIVTETIKKFQSPGSELMCYLAPAISQDGFQVGEEVLEAFLQAATLPYSTERIRGAFKRDESSPKHYYADLYHLARLELNALGVNDIYGGLACTYNQNDVYHSFRRDGDSGRCASAIWIDARA